VNVEVDGGGGDGDGELILNLKRFSLWATSAKFFGGWLAGECDCEQTAVKDEMKSSVLAKSAVSGAQETFGEYLGMFNTYLLKSSKDLQVLKERWGWLYTYVGLRRRIFSMHCSNVGRRQLILLQCSNHPANSFIQANGISVPRLFVASSQPTKISFQPFSLQRQHSRRTAKSLLIPP
jgi:hypothetical protein